MMRSALALLCTVLLIGACSRAKRAALAEPESVVSPARSASVLGDWVLANVEETQFVTARQVELRLRPGSFTLTAHYEGRAPLVVDGTASFDPAGGMLTLTPTQNTRAAAGGDQVLPVGQPIAILATAADNTMVFAQPGDAIGRPTSVWHRRDAARAAGTLDTRIAGADSARVP